MSLFLIPYPVSPKKGLSLIEVILVVAILAILATVGVISWRGFQNTAELNAAADAIVGLATEARGNAISGQDFTQWGIHVENPTVGISFAALFTGPTYSAGVEKRRIILPPKLEFNIPSEGTAIDALFRQRSGEVTDGITKTLELYLKATPSQKIIIKIYSSGLIEIGIGGFSDTPVKLANPATLPTGSGSGASFSPDNTYLAISHVVSPYVTIYKGN